MPKKPPIATLDSNLQATTVPKKRGRKPSTKVFEIAKEKTTPGSQPLCIMAHIPLSASDIQKITGKKVASTTEEKEKEKSTKQTSELESLTLGSDENYRELYRVKCTEVNSLKETLKTMEEKLAKFEFISQNVVDNGTVSTTCYHLIKDIFIDKDGNSWKQSTDKPCWWCFHRFSTMSIGLPESYDNITKQFCLRGNFCSFNCAHAYNIDLRDYKSNQRYSLLYAMKKHIFDNNGIINIDGTDVPKEIIAAPSRELLLTGVYTIEQFRKNQIYMPSKYLHLLPPSIPMITAVEEIPYALKPKEHESRDYNEQRVVRTKPIKGYNSDLLKYISSSK